MSGKRAVIDIGSNTVRLVVYNGPARAPIVLLNEKVAPRLGRDVARQGALSEKSMQVTLAAMKRYAALLRLMDATDVQTVATAAVRDADNGQDLLRQIAAIGLEPRLLSGEEEARISALGVIAAFPGAHGIAGDLGGGSLELTRIDNGSCHEGMTLPYGTLRLPDLRADRPARFARRIKKDLAAADWAHGKHDPFYIVGGSWRALALYAMTAFDWPLEDPHDFELSPDDAVSICAKLASGQMDLEVPRISPSRLASLPDAAALLGALVEEIEPSRIVFSSWGLREGLLYSRLDAQTQASDPMLAGVAAFARSYEVDPAAARNLASWVSAIFPETDETDAHLLHGAAMLALAAMRSEPNMRTDHAMGWALRKRWIGLDARGRAMMAMAVLANSGQTNVPPEFIRLAGRKDLETGTCWGLAIRLCRKLTGCIPAALQEVSVTQEDEILSLTLKPAAHALFANSATKDLRNLAERLGVEWKVEQLFG